MSAMYDFLKRERDAFELFKEAYRARFPAGPGPPPYSELNVPAPQLAAEKDADAARVSLLFVALDEPLLAEAEECMFAEIEWL